MRRKRRPLPQSQPFNSLLSSQSLSGDLHKTAATDPSMHVRGVLNPPNDRVIVIANAIFIPSLYFPTFVPLSENLRLRLVGGENQSPLDHACNIDLVFLLGSGEFNHPFVVFQGIFADPTNTFPDGHEPLLQVFSRGFLSITRCVPRISNTPILLLPILQSCPSPS